MGGPIAAVGGGVTSMGSPPRGDSDDVAEALRTGTVLFLSPDPGCIEKGFRAC